jgi:hypothetical protein
MPAEITLNMMKRTLNSLLIVPANERYQVYLTFKILSERLANESGPLDTETERRMASLLWFCERMSRLDFAPQEIQSSALAWPQTLIDAIKMRMRSQEVPPTADDNGNSNFMPPPFP